MQTAIPKKQLRDYQEAALDAIRKRYGNGINRLLLSAATGSGKTEICSFHIKEKIEDGQNCLFLAHRDRLVTQAAERIEGIVGWGKVGIVNGSNKDWWKSCVVGTIQSAGVEKQLLKAPKFQNIIIDECHRSNAKQYKKVIDELLVPGGLLLGVTATPNRTDKRGLIPEVFHELVYEIGMKELIDKGYLCQVVGKEIRLPIDFSKIRTSVSTDGIRDYRPDEIKEAFEQANWLGRITEGWKAVASDRRTIAFVPPGVVDGRGCGMAHSLAEYMRLQGINAAAVDGTTKQSEQDRVIDEFTQGYIQVLVNVNIFTEGLDIPPIDCVLFARPTKSSIIYSQSIGRGTRLYPGKENCLVIDVTGITEQLVAEGQSLMTLGKILPTEEQIANEKADRRKAAKTLIRKFWLKHITLKLDDDGNVQVRGQIGVKDQKRLSELLDEVKEILSEEVTKSAIVDEEGEPRAVNTELLSSDRFEIREIDFSAGGINLKWNCDPISREATLRHRGVTYKIWRPEPNGKYLYADMTTASGFEGNTNNWQSARSIIESRINGQEVRRNRIFKDEHATWRRKPITEKQRRKLQSMRISIPANCTAGEASDLLSIAFNKYKA